MMHGNQLIGKISLPQWHSTADGPGNEVRLTSKVLVLPLVSCLLFIVTICAFRDYFTLVDKFGDNQKYMTIALSIRHWNFQGLQVKAFWGLPYLMAALSLLTGASDRTALLLISFVASFMSIGLASRLWGVWIASLFAVLDFSWMQRSFLGGAEPLFMLLLFGTFLAVRKDKWLLAAFLASLDTIVRPVGIFALLAIGLTLLWRRQFKAFLLAAIIGFTVGILYALPLATYFGSPFANVGAYQHHDWNNGMPIGLPFYGIFQGTLLTHEPWTNLLLNYGWVVLTLLGLVAIITNSNFHAFGRSHPVEALFAVSYLAFLFTYSASYTLGAFPRYVLPALPLLLVALDPWIPKTKWLLWSIAIVSPILSAVSAIGINYVLGLI